jgi:hypothetical protein
MRIERIGINDSQLASFDGLSLRSERIGWQQRFTARWARERTFE